jgi:hypothetical protein
MSKTYRDTSHNALPQSKNSTSFTGDCDSLSLSRVRTRSRGREAGNSEYVGSFVAIGDVVRDTKVNSSRATRANTYRLCLVLTATLLETCGWPNVVLRLSPGCAEHDHAALGPNIYTASTRIERSRIPRSSVHKLNVCTGK